MDQKALFTLPYGLYLLTTKAEEEVNGCIINTCMQVANDPVRIAVSVLNQNYTCELLKKSGLFTLNLLDQNCTFETIQHFGFQLGRDVNKFETLSVPTDCNQIPYIAWHTCSVFSARVTQQYDLGTHTLFIAELVDARLLSDVPPLTYADYQNHLKPKPQKETGDKKIVGWRCRICNYRYEGSELPADFICPLCGHGADDFEPIYESVD